jgi:DNA-binding CsgD family transcriptional regulator
MTVRALTELAQSALVATTREEARAEILRCLQPRIGFDYGVLWRPGDEEATLSGFDQSFFRRYRAREYRYRDDLASLAGAAAAQHGVTRDVVALDAARRARSAFYAEIIHPVGSRSFLTAILALRGRVVALLQLGRGEHRAFREREADRLRALLPIATLCEAAHDPAAPLTANTEELTPREHQILRYLTLGFTNREIALACGSSPNTVRNQLVSIFRKAGVTTRAELVAWSVGALP